MTFYFSYKRLVAKLEGKYIVYMFFPPTVFGIY